MKDYDEIFDDMDDSVGDEEVDDAAMLMEQDEDDDEDDDIDVELRSIVMTKNDLLALLGLKTSARGGIIVRVDPREENPAAQLYDTAEAATRWFNRSVATSRRNGWQIVYDGEPAFG